MTESLTRFDLPQSAIPTRWYNIQADLPRPLPPVLHPGTKQPIGPADLAPLFPMELIKQEVSRERFIEIPEEVREIYKLWRPTPLLRARRLEKAIGTTARIYYKYEGGSPSGSHKLNTAVPQAFYNKQEGVQGLTTETGAGQWGTAISQACNFFGLECFVWMVRVSYDQKPHRRSMIQSFGARVSPSPSDLTATGRAILEKDPHNTGSLGMASIDKAATPGWPAYGQGPIQLNGDWYVPQLPVGAPLRVARPLGVGQASATMGVFVSDSADAANLPTPFVALYGDRKSVV